MGDCLLEKTALVDDQESGKKSFHEIIGEKLKVFYFMLGRR